MKFKGQLTAVILVLIANCFYIFYYFLRDGYIGTIELFGLPILLLIAWWCGKQFDTVKQLKETDEQKSQDYQRRHKHFQAIFEYAPIGIAIIDKNGKPIVSNRKLQEILGYSEEELNAMTFSEFSHPEDNEINMKLLKELYEGAIDHYYLEKRYFRNDGGLVWGEVTSALFPGLDDGSYNIIGMVNDITERKRAELHLKEAYDELEVYSNRDGLTGLANRRFLNQYLLREYSHAIRHKRPLSLIMLDIDYFKQYNDKYGHLIGDECLKQVATALEKTVNRAKDLVARYGGEEFILILPETEKLGASHIADKIRSSIEELNIPHIGSPIHRFLTVSVGVTTFIADSETKIDNLILEADKALYQAKQNGRNRVQVFNQEMKERIVI